CLASAHAMAWPGADTVQRSRSGDRRRLQALPKVDARRQGPAPRHDRKRRSLSARGRRRDDRKENGRLAALGAIKVSDEALINACCCGTFGADELRVESTSGSQALPTPARPVRALRR